jgi:hypothetical protein
MANNSVSNADFSSPSSLRALRTEKIAAFNKAKNDFETMKKQIKSIQDSLIEELQKNHPDIKDDYKSGFKDYSEDAIGLIKAYIRASGQVEKLDRLLEEKDRLDLAMLDAERSLTQIEKIERLKKMAKVDSLLTVFASRSIAENYEKLVSCENTFL